ncbi:hypothetical protein C0J50_20298 [Silurus asotus]|uniref:Ig-like domain-containing protein n=1 Tax=Silurus asotus TaxID=30991 RepID=A0AAD5APK6_SILAS|nr:hypothetical protein C0J50_20298 [Silurus asotus]
MVVLSPETPLAAKTREVRLGAAVTLQCDLSNRYEINWMKMSSDMKPELLMVLGLKNNGDLSVTRNSNSSSFQGFFQNRLFQLRILRVSEADLGVYFCLAVNQRHLELGEAIRLDAVLDVKQPPDQNLTHCQSYGGKTCRNHEPYYVEYSSSVFFYTTHILCPTVTSCLLIEFFILVISELSQTCREKLWTV